MESRIKMLREKRGLIQELLAVEIGVTQQMLSKYEKDITIIKVDVLKRIAEYFNVTTDYLLGLSDMKRDLSGQIKMNETLDEYYDLIEVYRRMDGYDREMVWSILAYAERGEREKLIQFVTDIIEDGRLRPSEEINTGNIVTDSLVGYWKKKAEDAGIEFLTDLSIPMEMPFRGADISLIMGNLLENAVEGAGRAEGRKYIRLKMKYDKNNLLITIENSYRGKLAKGKGEELRTTKTDTSNHGIGLPSVRRAADKYQGVLSVDTTEPGRFLARVVLYGS